MNVYTFTAQNGWMACAADDKLPDHVQDSEELGDWLFAAGYRRLAQSGPGRCDVGHFYVWVRHTERQSASPTYGIEIDQVGADSLVWIATLPDLGEFLSRYASIGFSMHRWLAGDEDDAPMCPDCGEPMTRVDSANDDDAPEWDA